MYYLKFCIQGFGFTNQIFGFITGIINAYKEGHNCVVVDNFLNDINKTKYTAISNIFNIDAINIFLKKKYNIIVIDKNDIFFEIVSAKYGTNDVDYIDLTDFIKSEYVQNNKLFIKKTFNFNEIKGDPCVGKEKKFILKYKINDYIVEEIYNEYLMNDIIIDFNSPFSVGYGWINAYNNNMFDNILTNIKYNNDFILKSNLVLKDINTSNKINVIHLRLELDGLLHWSIQNNITYNEYKSYLEEKYINIIKKYISKDDENIILSSSLSNGVIDFLNTQNYKYMSVNKFFDDREKNAIIDLLVSKCCNNIFIGNFNMSKNNGSTFSYYIWKYIKNNTTKIYIDPDNIYDDEVIVYGDKQ